METAPLLFDLGKQKPTTRQFADLVKAGGADAALSDSLRPDPGERDAVRVTAEPVPRLHARLPLLLRPPLPDAVRARLRRRVRVDHLREDEPGGGAAARAAAAVMDR